MSLLQIVTLGCFEWHSPAWSMVAGRWRSGRLEKVVDDNQSKKTFCRKWPLWLERSLHSAIAAVGMTVSCAGACIDAIKRQCNFKAILSQNNLTI